MFLLGKVGITLKYIAILREYFAQCVHRCFCVCMGVCLHVCACICVDVCAFACVYVYDVSTYVCV